MARIAETGAFYDPTVISLAQRIESSREMNLLISIVHMNWTLRQLAALGWTNPKNLITLSLRIDSSHHESYFRSIFLSSICNTWPVVYPLTIRNI